MKNKPISALEFERRFPEVQGRRATYSNINAGNVNIGGTLTVPVNSGSGTVPLNTLAVQTYAGSAVLTLNVGGTTFYFASTGTIAP